MGSVPDLTTLLQLLEHWILLLRITGPDTRNITHKSQLDYYCSSEDCARELLGSLINSIELDLTILSTASGIKAPIFWKNVLSRNDLANRWNNPICWFLSFLQPLNFYGEIWKEVCGRKKQFYNRHYLLLKWLIIGSGYYVLTFLLS